MAAAQNPTPIGCWLLKDTSGPTARSNKSSHWLWEATEPLPRPRVAAASARPPWTTTPLLLPLLQVTVHQRSIMGFQKFSLFLALSILVLYQVDNLHAVPFRSALESIPDVDKLSEEQARHLLAELVQDYVQMKAGELEQELETEGSSLDSARSKRCSNLSTCMLGMYTQDLNKFHTFPQTATGAGAPGKRRDMAIDQERDQRPPVGIPQPAN